MLDCLYHASFQNGFEAAYKTDNRVIVKRTRSENISLESRDWQSLSVKSWIAWIFDLSGHTVSLAIIGSAVALQKQP